MARRLGAATALPADIRHRPHRNGKSDKPLGGWDYTFANDARIVEALMDEWGHDEMIVVSDDWGRWDRTHYRRGVSRPDRPVRLDELDVVRLVAGRGDRVHRPVGFTGRGDVRPAR